MNDHLQSFMRLGFTLALACAVLYGPFLAANAESANTTVGRLFSDPEYETPGGFDQAPYFPAVRHRFGRIDQGTLELARDSAGHQSPIEVSLNLFDDFDVTAVITDTDTTFSGGYSLSAYIPGNPPGSFELVVNGDTVVGAVKTVEGAYRIVSDGEGNIVISEIDSSNVQLQLENDVLEPNGDW